MKVVVYCRVSTQDQTTDNQSIPLIQYCNRMGWEYELFVEKESTRNTRPIQVLVYNKLLRKEFDGLVIYKFDRWARSTKELVDHMERLFEKGVAVYSYSENIDLSSSMGRAMLTIISAFAQLERDLIRERTLAGLKRAKAWGKIGGRHPVNCGCGKIFPNGTKHDGLIKPIRNESNVIIGWDENKLEQDRLKRSARKSGKEFPMKAFCELCKAINVKLERHHPDYNKPKFFLTLCVACHKKVEKQTPPIQPDVFCEEIKN